MDPALGGKHLFRLFSVHDWTVAWFQSDVYAKGRMKAVLGILLVSLVFFQRSRWALETAPPSTFLPSFWIPARPSSQYSTTHYKSRKN